MFEWFVRQVRRWTGNKTAAPKSQGGKVWTPADMTAYSLRLHDLCCVEADGALGAGGCKALAVLVHKIAAVAPRFRRGFFGPVAVSPQTGQLYGETVLAARISKASKQQRKDLIRNALTLSLKLFFEHYKVGNGRQGAKLFFWNALTQSPSDRERLNLLPLTFPANMTEELKPLSALLAPGGGGEFPQTIRQRMAEHLIMGVIEAMEPMGVQAVEKVIRDLQSRNRVALQNAVSQYRINGNQIKRSVKIKRAINPDDPAELLRRNMATVQKACRYLSLGTWMGEKRERTVVAPRGGLVDAKNFNISEFLSESPPNGQRTAASTIPPPRKTSAVARGAGFRNR